MGAPVERFGHGPEPWDAPWLNDTPPSRWSRASALVWWLLRVVVIALALTSAFISGLMLIRALWP